MSTIDCYIYRCSARADMYLYLSEKDNFDIIPDELKKNLGNTHFSMMLELHRDKKLAKENAVEVISNLEQRGFHLQMPSDTPISEILERLAQNEQKKFSQKNQ